MSGIAVAIAACERVSSAPEEPIPTVGAFTTSRNSISTRNARIVEPWLRELVPSDHSIESSAWTSDGRFVVMVTVGPDPCACMPGDGWRTEDRWDLVIASADRHTTVSKERLHDHPEIVIAASDDHFVVVRQREVVTLLDPQTAEIVATWALPDVISAAAIPRGIAALGSDGAVRVGCVEGGVVTQVAEAHVGRTAKDIAVVGDRIAVTTSNDDVRVASLRGACP